MRQAAILILVNPQGSHVARPIKKERRTAGNLSSDRTEKEILSTADPDEENNLISLTTLGPKGWVFRSQRGRG